MPSDLMETDLRLHRSLYSISDDEFIITGTRCSDPEYGLPPLGGPTSVCVDERGRCTLVIKPASSCSMVMSMKNGDPGGLSTSMEADLSRSPYPICQQMNIENDDGRRQMKQTSLWNTRCTSTLCFIIILIIILGMAILLLITIITSLSYPKHPCDSFTCTNGMQTCILDAHGNPSCICQSTCSYSIEEPVCGSDNRTYHSECDLEYRSCLESLPSLAILHHGPCISSINNRNHRDPCESIDCTHGAVCVRSDSLIYEQSSLSLSSYPMVNGAILNGDRQFATCQCPPCDDQPDARAICGSDGQTYPSLCALKTTSCTHKLSISPGYEGPCQSCSNVECFNYANCEVDPDSGKPGCKCPKVCLREENPVCASNGKTYENECELRMSSCHLQINITIVHRGSCVPDLCESVDCKHHSICRHGQCICDNINCDDELYLEPICADDGATYSNACELKKTSCLKQVALVPVFFGTCQEMKSLDTRKDAQERTKDGDEATKLTNQVVKSGPNEDELISEKEAKNERENWPESMTRGNEKEKFAHDENDHRNDDIINRDADKSSGGDNHSHFDSANNAPPIHTRHHHNLSSQLDPKLHSLDASNHRNVGEISTTKTHGNPPNCYAKQCLFGASCQLDSNRYPVCNCVFNCDNQPVDKKAQSLSTPRYIFLPLVRRVCGSDGQLYQSECAMKKESCRLQKNIVTVDMKNCDHSSNHGSIHDHHVGSNVHGSSSQPKDVGANCLATEFGCCLDGQSTALGADYLGCPERCFCNPRGSLGPNCDPQTRQCPCKPGIGGKKCNRCEPGFWGFHKIQGGQGCLPCNCSKYGSVRIDCEQTTGQCVCIPGIKGLNCNQCPAGTTLGPLGCTHESFGIPRNGSCHDIHCFHGAICVQNGNIAQCICDNNCAIDENVKEYKILCGSDSNTYQSECQLRRASCLQQTHIMAKHLGPC